jgi:hypothetical protein
MRTVFIVIAESDATMSWPVAAYPTEEGARAHAVAADRESEKAFAALYQGGAWVPNPFDTGLRQEYGPPWYCVAEVPFARHPDEYLETRQP